MARARGRAHDLPRADAHAPRASVPSGRAARWRCHFDELPTVLRRPARLLRVSFCVLGGARRVVYARRADTFTRWRFAVYLLA